MSVSKRPATPPTLVGVPPSEVPVAANAVDAPPSTPTNAVDTGPDWHELWQLLTTALPVLALLLPAAGYVVRWIAFSTDSWIPSHIALYAPISELALTGFGAVLGGAWGFTLFIALAFRRPGLSVYPFGVIRDTWRDYGPTKDRRARIGRRLRSIREAIGRLRRASWSVSRARIEARALQRRLRLYLAQPRAKRKLLLWPFIAFAPVALTFSAIFTVYVVINAIVGVTLGAAIQNAAAYLALWRLDHLARSGGSITLRFIAPVTIAYVAASAFGAGLNPSFPLRPSNFAFDPASGVSSGTYQEIGRTDGVLYLVPCGPPAQTQVVGVQISEVRSEAFLGTFTPTPRVRLQDALSRPLDIGYRPCN